MVAQHPRVDASRLALPPVVLGHRHDQPEARQRPLELLQLVQERGRLAIAIRVDECHLVGLAGIGDVSEHAAEDGDPDSARHEHVLPLRVLGQVVVALRLLDLDLVADLELGQRALEGGVAQARAEPEHPALGRRGDDADVPPRALLVVVGRVEQLDPEVLAGREVDLLALEVEDDQQGPFRDLPLLFDSRAHRGK